MKSSDAGRIAAMLAQHAPALARELLPAGKRRGHEFVCGSLHGEAGESLSVRLDGPRAGVWADFASGERGDILDLVACARFGGDLGAALRWARGWLGLSDAQPARRAPDSAPPTAATADADALQRRRAAWSIFSAAQPRLRDTPADFYLRARGLDLRDTGRQPAALRYHPSVWNAEMQQHLPAMVAAITDAAGGFLALHRTYLARDPAGIWRKAPLRAPKKALGSFAGGMIHLSAGDPATSLAAAAPGAPLIIGEGIETTLAAVLAVPHLRAVAGVSLTNLGMLRLPPAIAAVTLLRDLDSSEAARRAFDTAVSRLLSQGRTVRVAVPPHGKDFADVAMQDLVA